MAITSAQHSELNRLSDRDGVQTKTNRLGDVVSEVASANLSVNTSFVLSQSVTFSNTESKVVSAH